MDKFKIKDRIDELKGAGEHGRVIRQRTGDSEEARKAIQRRTRRRRKVEFSQSDAARAAGHRAFERSRLEGEGADVAVSRQATASAKVRRAEKNKRRREDSHTVYEYIGAILAESLGLVEAVKLSSEYRKGREVDHTFTDSESGRKAKITRQSRTTNEPEFTATTSRGRKLSGDKARRYFNRLMARRTPPKPSSEEMADQIERRNRPRSRRSTVTGKNVPTGL